MTYIVLLTSSCLLTELDCLVFHYYLYARKESDPSNQLHLRVRFMFSGYDFKKAMVLLTLMIKS